MSKMQADKTVTVGCLPYLVSLPLSWKLLHLSQQSSSSFLQRIKVHPSPPSTLSALLEKGDLHLSPFSAIHYPLVSRTVTILPGLCIASQGRVRSVVLASLLPWNQLRGKPVAVVSASATSAAALKILFSNEGMEARVYPAASPLEEINEGRAGAALLIGDEGLKFSYSPSTFYWYDLGQVWEEAFGVPLVYALWGIQKNLEQEIVNDLHAFLLSSLNEWERVREEMIGLASQSLSLPPDFLEEYFSLITYRLGRNEEEGLKKLLKEAEEV